MLKIENYLKAEIGKRWKNIGLSNHNKLINMLLSRIVN